MYRNHSSSVIRKLFQRYYKANKTRNIILACAIILTTILITAACSTFYSYLKLSKHQEMKETGTSANVILSRPTQNQLDLLSKFDILKPEMNIQTKMGSLVNNKGQAGIDIQMISSTNWEEYSGSLVDNMQGTYPAKGNEIMMSTWLLNRLGYSKPRNGMEVSLSVAISDISKNGDAEVQSLPFTLSGFYEDTANINSENNRIVFFSETFLREHPQEVPNLVGLLFKDTRHYHDKIEQIRASIDLDGNQQLIPSYDGKLNMNVKDSLVAVIMVLFFMFDGYLIIFNVAYISITRDVRFYGLLKMLGMTSAQIKQIVYYSVAKVAFFALPVGMLLGWGLSFYVVPLALSSYEGFSSIDRQVNLWVLLLALFFSALTLFLSYRAPAKKAGRISPIEASKHTDTQSGKQKSRGRHGAKIPYMSLKNILHSKKRLLFVVLTLFLGSTALVVLSTFLKSFSAEEYINAEVKYDIAMYNQMTRASFNPTEEQHFTPELLSQISAVNGIRELERTTVVSIFQHYSDSTHGEWLRNYNEFRAGVNEELRDKKHYEEDPKTNFWGLLIGIDDKKLEEYNRTAKNPINLSDFSKGKIALVTDINGNGIPIGVQIPFTVIDNNKSYKVKIGGQMTFERDAMNSGAAPWLIVSNNVINKYHSDAVIYSIKINAQKGKEQDVLNEVKLLTSGDSSISRTSKIEQAKAFADLKQSFSNLSIVIIIILSSIGVLNFINTILVSIVSRKQEFAVLASIGATKKQIKWLITFEGIWFALIAFVLTLIVGSGISYLVFNILHEYIGYGVFRYPVTSLIIYSGVVLLICSIIPGLLYKSISRSSVIEQLRQAE